MTTQTETKWYDSIEEIRKAVRTLDGLNGLISERHKAHYKRGENMAQWVVRGLWYLDTCGNCGKSQIHVPGAPTVLTPTAFTGYAKEKYCSFSMSEEPPPTDVVCPHCHKGWTISNCHDNFRLSDTEVISFKDHVGQPLKEVAQKPEFKRRREAHIMFATESSLQNDKYIDLTQHPDYDTLKINEKGWVRPAEDHIIEEGDQGLFWVFKWVHQDCRKKSIAKRNQEVFRKAFKDAGFVEISFEPIPNEYCPEQPCSICGPWYYVRTRLGRFKLGWRKRVMSLHTEGLGLNLSKLFEKEDVTKAADYIHAWGYEKLTEYLKRIHEELKK